MARFWKQRKLIYGNTPFWRKILGILITEKKSNGGGVSTVHIL